MKKILVYIVSLSMLFSNSTIAMAAQENTSKDTKTTITAKSEIVKQQLTNPDVNVFTNKKFGEKDSENGFAMDSLFTVDEAALQKAFGFDASAMNNLEVMHTQSLKHVGEDVVEALKNWEAQEGEKG